VICCAVTAALLKYLLVTENHVNAFQQIEEIICVIYESFFRENREKTNLGIDIIKRKFKKFN